MITNNSQVLNFNLQATDPDIKAGVIIAKVLKKTKQRRKKKKEKKPRN